MFICHLDVDEVRITNLVHFEYLPNFEKNNKASAGARVNES